MCDQFCKWNNWMIFCFVLRINSIDPTGITPESDDFAVNFFFVEKLWFSDSIDKWSLHVIRSAIGELGPYLFLGTIGTETKSSTYGLPGKWWDLTKFPRKLSTVAPAPVKVDAWSGLQIEQLINLGRSCYPVSNWRTRTIFAFENNWHWDKKQYLWTTWQVVGSYKISPKTVDYRGSSSNRWCLIRSANRTTE